MINVTLEEFARRFPHIGSSLATEELDELIGLLKTQYVESSEALITEGTVTDSLYFVWEGELDVIMQSPDGEYKVAVIEQGELLGEISLLSPGKATATVRSETGCIALHLDVDGLNQFWDQYPHAASVFMRELSRVVAQRIHHANERLKELQRRRSVDAQAVIRAQSKLISGE